MSNVASVSMEHQDSQLSGLPFVRWSDEECIQGLAIGRWESKILVIGDPKLVWPGDPFFGSCAEWKVARIYEFTSVRSVDDWILLQAMEATDFCFQYSNPLPKAASPDDARNGTRSHDRNAAMSFLTRFSGRLNS